MAIAVKVSDELAVKARVHGKVQHRSTAGQIEHWASIGRLVEENPDLPYQFLQRTLLGLEELKDGQVEPYIFGEGKS